MTHYRITSLRLGELYLPHGASVMRDPIHCWLVQGNGRNILVDSGMAEIPMVTKRLKVNGCGGGHPALLSALAAQGLEPGDISHVVLTHLHFDHADNLDLFPDACIVIQRAELMAAIDPVPSQRIYYWKSTIANLMARKRPSELLLVDGDHDLFPGLHLLSVPSHTEGMQVVVVSTERAERRWFRTWVIIIAIGFPLTPARPITRSAPSQAPFSPAISAARASGIGRRRWPAFSPIPTSSCLHMIFAYL